MTLGEKQELFMRLLPRLIGHALILGFQIRGGELLRFEAQARWNATHCRVCKQAKSDIRHTRTYDTRYRRKHHRFRAIGIVKSLHRLKLAIDLILFKNGKPCWKSEQYRDLGTYWKSLNPLCRWGGDFRNPDGGHFSLNHQGRA
jgi:hypothetical protein